RTEVVPLPLGSASTVVPARKARTRDLVLLAVMVASLAANGVLASLVIARNGSSARLAGSVSSAPGPGDMGLRTTRPVTRGGARNGVVERHLIRWLARAPIAAIPTPLRSGRSTNSFETVCLPAGTPGSY